ncbi:polyprenol monophosphomannose synthase [Haloarcula rubripromontorii]|uniref:polyprenol monophosphomannose synthase n=1 Tax=Haloarcula rubripromontorii TaxID=1705562 RepID=UPI00345BFC7A
MPGDYPTVSVVLPTYNERQSVLPVLHDLEWALNSADHEWEVIVVDDDSPDRTWELVRDSYDDHPRVRVIRRTEQSGLSSAVLRGFTAANGETLVCMDADGQHPAEKVPALVEAADGGFAVGSRHCEGGSIDGWPWTRKVVSAVAGKISHLTIPSSRSISDPMSGFFAVDADVLDDEVFVDADPHGYKILLELLVVSDASVSEVPITFDTRDAGESKLTPDEQVRFVEHSVGLGIADRGLNLNAPLLIRSVELGLMAGVSVLMLLVGIIVGGLDGAVGAGLIGGAGSLLVLGMLRWLDTGESWEETA